MKAYLFLNGDPPRRLPEKDRLSVCADGAYTYLAARNYLPDVVLGDFDSVSLTAVDPAVEIVRFPVEKDYTDGHLAVRLLAERGCTELEIYGAFGGSRPDHALCNYSLLAYARELGMQAVLADDAYTVRLLTGTYSATAAKGAVVSLVPFSDEIHILYTKGLKYVAEGLTVDKTHIVSVSNAALGGMFSVSVTGSALLFVERKEDI